MSLELIFLSFERLGIEPRKMSKNSLAEGRTRWLQDNTLPPSSHRIAVCETTFTRAKEMNWEMTGRREVIYHPFPNSKKHSVERDASHLGKDLKLNMVFRTGQSLVAPWAQDHGRSPGSVLVGNQGNTSTMPLPKSLLAQLNQLLGVGTDK